MEKLKINFRSDIISGEEIPFLELKNELKKIKNKRNFYYSEVADYYYKKKYNKNILQILSDYYEIPTCPVTGDLVSYKLTGSILFGKYSSSCDLSKMTKHIAENNEDFINFVEKMKIERKGEGNPMHGLSSWNKGLTKDTNDILKKISENMKGYVFSDEILKKMSESAKKRKIHGHTGYKHSEKSKQMMREKTIERFKQGKFPQTNSAPHIKTKNILKEIYGNLNDNFCEEFEYGGFVFDFKVGKFLIEVQGDYFHCNPNTRHAIPKNDMQIKNLERDKRKRKFVEDNKEYKLIEIWENDIVNNIEKVKECLKNLKK